MKNYFDSDSESDGSLSSSSDDYDSNSLKNKDRGYTSFLNKDTPLIKSLINKRITYCNLGASSHIAAFFPESIRTICCQESSKGKDRYW